MWLLRKCYDELMTSLMVLMFEWVIKFRIWVLTVIIGTYVYGILVIDGYLCSRVYGMSYSSDDLTVHSDCEASGRLYYRESTDLLICSTQGNVQVAL